MNDPGLINPSTTWLAWARSAELCRPAAAGKKAAADCNDAANTATRAIILAVDVLTAIELQQDILDCGLFNEDIILYCTGWTRSKQEQILKNAGGSCVP
jgi:hypothetical protein